MPSPAIGVPTVRGDSSLARRRERRLLVLAVCCAAALAVLYLAAVRTGWGQRIDNTALDGRTTRPAVLHSTDRLLNTISVSSLIVGGGAIVLIALLRRRPHLAVTAAVVVVGANVTAEVLKHWVLGRPMLTTPNPLGPSFPSGHTTVATSLALALVLVVPEAIRGVTAVAGFAYAALVGTGTVTAGWHRPSDVVGGFLVATAWAAAATSGLVAWRGATRARGTAAVRMPLVPPLLAGAGLALLALAFVGFVGTLVAIRQNTLDAVRLDAAYAAAMTAIVGSGLVLLAVFLAQLRGVGFDPTEWEEAGALVRQA